MRLKRIFCSGGGGGGTVVPRTSGERNVADTKECTHDDEN
jgi:hypothetical protein